jgi:hypothetical protein
MIRRTRENLRVAALDGTVGFVHQLKEIAVQDQRGPLLDSLIQQPHQSRFLMGAKGVASFDAEMQVRDRHLTQEPAHEPIQGGQRFGLNRFRDDMHPLSTTDQHRVTQVLGEPMAGQPRRARQVFRFALLQCSQDHQAFASSHFNRNRRTTGSRRACRRSAARPVTG